MRWGKMSLPELLRDLIADDGPREQLFRQVGIRPPRAPADAEYEPAPAAAGAEYEPGAGGEN